MDADDLSYWEKIMWVPPPAQFASKSYDQDAEVDTKMPYFLEITNQIETPFKLLDKMTTETRLAKKKFTCPITFFLRPQRTYSGSTPPVRKIVLRFCNIKRKVEKADVLPSKLRLFVNGSPCRVPTFSVPIIDITDYVNFLNDGFNMLLISWKEWGSQIFTVSVLEGRPVPSAQLALKLICDLPFDDRRVRSKNIMFSEYEKNHGLIISLRCPISKKRMVGAVRSIHCTHMKCFDINSYISLNEVRPTWKCPICHAYAPIETLVLCRNYVLESRTLKRLPNASRIQINYNGTWHPIRPCMKRSNMNLFTQTRSN